MKRWPVMLATFVLIFGALAWYVASMPVRYASTSVVAFQPEPDRADGRDLVSLLVQTYPEFAASQTVVDAAASKAGVSPGELREGLNAGIPPLTLIMQITTQLPDGRGRMPQIRRCWTKYWPRARQTRTFKRPQCPMLICRSRRRVYRRSCCTPFRWSSQLAPPSS
jgi:hypothetical protein